MKKNIIVLCVSFFVSNVSGLATTAIGSVAGQLASSAVSGKDDGSIFSGIKNFFSQQGVDLKKVTVYTSTETNQGAPVKIHLVAVFNSKYEHEVKSSLDILTANEYVSQAEQLKKKFPDTMICLSWDILAKNGVHPLTLEKDGKSLFDCGHLTATKAYIFVENYQKCDKTQPQMGVVPDIDDLGIFLDKDTFFMGPNQKISKMAKAHAAVDASKVIKGN